MKVSELIKRLQKCEQDAEVEFAHESDETTSGFQVSHVVQMVFFEDETREGYSVVQLQGV